MVLDPVYSGGGSRRGWEGWLHLTIFLFKCSFENFVFWGNVLP